MVASLPRLFLISDRHRMQPDFESALKHSLRGGARLIQLREKNLAKGDLLPLAQKAQHLCERYGAQLVINSHSDIAASVGAAGIQLPESKFLSPSSPRPIGSLLRGISVHSPETARMAADAGADYLVFGSIFPTTSHPGEASQGLEALRAVTQSVTCPVYAIGGITPESVANCLAAGAHGVAIISAIWTAPDVASAVENFQKALDEF